MVNPIASFLDKFVVRKPVSFKGLTVFPVCLILGVPAAEEEIISLEEGLKDGAINVAESGRMDNVVVQNRGPLDALIMDGETLLGGAQNRVLNTSVVLRPGERTEMPASCVEVHRWDVKRGVEVPIGKKNFNRSDMAFAALRHHRMEDIFLSLARRERLQVDQKEVWRTIVQRFGICGAKTATLDLHDLYDFWGSALKLFAGRFHLIPAQTGMISFLNRKTWFADIFSHRALLLKQYKKILKSLAFDALVRLETKRELPAGLVPEFGEAREVMRSLRVARAQQMPDSKNFYLVSDKCFGFAAAHGKEVLYLSACSRHFAL